MCCNGTLFNYVALTDADLPALAKYPQLKIKIRNDRPTFDEACVLHTGSGCSAYDDRPDTCRRYVCEVVRGVSDERLTEQEAVAIIAEGRALVDNIQEYVAFEPGMPLSVSTWDDPPEDLEEDARLAWMRAFNHLHKHFLLAIDDEPATTPGAGGSVSVADKPQRFPREKLFER